MPPLKHIHQYIRVSRKQYMCSHPKCTSRELKKYLLGKSAICNQCLGEFILDGYALTVAKPLCHKCRTTRKGRETEKSKMLKKLENMEVL